MDTLLVAHATCLLLDAAMGWAATNLAGLVIGGWQANWTNPMGIQSWPSGSEI